MVSPGNGDYGNSYSRFKAQWAMPGWQKYDSLYHSFDIGRAHIVGINTEVIEYGVPHPDERDAMLRWFEDDMKRANEPSARKKRPWLIVHFHSQERTLPVSNKTVLSGPDPTRPYDNARAPTYIVSGNPGNAEETSTWGRGFDPWTAWRSYHFGYSHMIVHNSTTLTVDFMSTNLG